MRQALLVTDLEGVAGVDRLESLVIGGPDHDVARELLTAEVLAAVEGLRDAGFGRVRLSDSHRAGGASPNVIAERLPPGVELDWRDDAYAPELWEGIDAVACLGMHAAADTPGFAAHTVTFHCAFTAAGRKLSESDLVLGLAAERGVPTVFVSGCDVLGESLAVPYVVTKTSLSPAGARSVSPEEARAAIRRAAAGAPVASPALPAGPWQIGWKSRWQERLGGSEPIEGPTTAARYAQARARLAPTEVPFARAIRTFDARAMAEDVCAITLRGFERAPPAPRPEAAARALSAFLGLTDGGEVWQRADRALALQLLEGLAPAFFARHALAPIFADAVGRLDAVPAELPIGLDAREAMWRMDAAYVRAGAGRPARLDGVVDYVRAVAPENPLAAWLIWEMGHQIGLCPASRVPPRPLRPFSRIHDLYWLTHLFFLEIRYGRRPFEPRGWEAEIEELTLAVPWVLGESRLDIAAELALCLQIAGEADCREHHALIAALVAEQREDGAVPDPGPGPAFADRDSHSTEVALLALARLG